MFKVKNKDTSSSVSIVNFEHVIAGWDRIHSHPVILIHFRSMFRFSVLHENIRKLEVFTCFQVI